MKCWKCSHTMKRLEEDDQTLIEKAIVLLTPQQIFWICKCGGKDMQTCRE